MHMARTNLLEEFSRRQEGAVAIIFGLTLMIMLAAAGIAVDYARALNIKSNLQADLDAAVLGAAAQVLSGDADENAVASTYFGDNWKAKHSVSQVELNIAKVNDGTGVAGTATVTVPTLIMRLFGHENIPVSATSEALKTSQDVEVALVVDTTGSMSGTKLEALKQASNTLIDTAYEKPDADQHVKISIVPFAQYVNVGMANRNASWMSVPADSSENKESCGYTSPVIGTSNCRMETFTGYNDGVPYTYQSQVCDYQYGPEEYQCTPYVETSTWTGCAGSRDYPLDTLDEQYGTPVPGVMNNTCGSELSPLSNDKDALKSQVDAFVATGETYIPAGLFWGWTTLSKEVPFNQARGYGEKVGGNPVRKILVLMTDGANTMSPNYPYHWGNDATQSNTLTAELCTNIKAKGIETFTVAFEVTDQATKDLLKDCATSSTNFFDASDSTQLEMAFQSIAKDFTPLRLAQ